MDEEVTLNPVDRVTLIKRWKKVRALLPEEKVKELAKKSFIAGEVGILGIIDNKIVHKEQNLIQNLQQWGLIASHAW